MKSVRLLLLLLCYLDLGRTTSSNCLVQTFLCSCTQAKFLLFEFNQHQLCKLHLTYGAFLLQWWHTNGADSLGMYKTDHRDLLCKFTLQNSCVNDCVPHIFFICYCSLFLNPHFLGMVLIAEGHYGGRTLSYNVRPARIMGYVMHAGWKEGTHKTTNWEWEQ